MNEEYELPDVHFTDSLSRILDNQADLLPFAFNQFKTEANIKDQPADINRADDDVRMFFLEWLTFDYIYKCGKTPLEYYLDNPPKISSAIEMSIMRQAAKTQFCSAFWILEADDTAHFALLEDINTGRHYRVFDKLFCSTSPNSGGMVGVRLMEVDGIWYFPGNIVFYYPVKPTERMKTMLRETDDDGSKQDSFTDLVRSRLGEKLEATDKMSFSPSLPLNEQEQRVRLVEIEEKINAYHDEGCIAASWDEIKTAFATAPLDVSLVGLINTLITGKENEDPDFDSEQELIEIVGLFFDAWNGLPHDALGGMSPNEKSSGRS